MKYILTEKELEIPEGIKVEVKSRSVTVQGIILITQVLWENSQDHSDIFHST